ncbi:hypothetical protein [Acinetobacter defluvii]|uniref:hypothetical protein n=1 Tax=Acinetobacter defluvii TaxID=1871111 RepID=UPI003AF99B34
MNVIKNVMIILIILLVGLYSVYFSPQKSDREVMEKIDSSLHDKQYRQICGVYLGGYSKYEKALRGDSHYFTVGVGGKNYDFLASRFKSDSLFYKFKSESRFDAIQTFNKGQNICVTFSTKYLEVDSSANYRQVPLLMSASLK